MLKLKIMVLSAIMLVLVSIPTYGYDLWKGDLDPWTKKDKNREIWFIAITVIDLYQTNYGLTSRPGEYYESNPFVSRFIGTEPTTEDLLRLGFSWIIIHRAISHISSEKVRYWWQTIPIYWTFYDTATSCGTKLIFGLK